MHHHSVRGVGVRYVLALTLPVTGLVLVVYTVVQLVLAQRAGIPPAPRRLVRAGVTAAPSPLPGEPAPPAPARR
ncbi:MAG TPA: hypothetical protein VF363_07585 [Candidatus Eisenbacteria bacterium]